MAECEAPTTATVLSSAGLNVCAKTEGARAVSRSISLGFARFSPRSLDSIESLFEIGLDPVQRIRRDAVTGSLSLSSTFQTLVRWMFTLTIPFPHPGDRKKEIASHLQKKNKKNKPYPRYWP